MRMTSETLTMFERNEQWCCDGGGRDSKAMCCGHNADSYLAYVT